MRDILLKAGEKRIEPRAALAVCRLRGKKAEDVRFVIACAVDFLAEGMAQAFFRDEDVRKLQPCEVERLARRGAGDRPRRRLGRERGKRRVLVAGTHEVGVNLVGDDENVVHEADRGKTLQLFAPDGVVRAAENQKLHLVLANLLLDVSEVHAVCAVLEEKRARDELAPIALDDAEKRIVDGLGYENGIIRRGKCTHRHGEREDDARRHDEGFLAGIPAVARAEPLFERPIVVLLRTRIAEDAVLGASANGITHRLRRTKVHVGDPERQNVLGIAALDGEIVFEAVRMTALDDLIKVEMVHERSLLSYALGMWLQPCVPRDRGGRGRRRQGCAARKHRISPSVCRSP